MSTKQKLSTAPAKRTGRPIKEARKGRRYQIGVIVTGETKSLIAARAKESGRTISREVEIMVERLLQYEGTLKRLYGTIEEMERGRVEATLVRLGYTPICPTNTKDGEPPAKERGGYWMVWAEPGYPGIQRNVFAEMELEARRTRQASPVREEPK